MRERTKRLITLLRDQDVHDQTDQLVFTWKECVALQKRIEILTGALAEQRKSNEKYAALHGVSNWEQ